MPGRGLSGIVVTFRSRTLPLAPFSKRPPRLACPPVARDRMTQLHDLRLRLLVQQESERIADSQPDDLDLSVVQARCLCWLALLAEAHEEQASDAERRGDVEQAMGWFADSMRLRDVLFVVSSIEIPLPAAIDQDDPGSDEPDGDELAEDDSCQDPWAA